MASRKTYTCFVCQKAGHEVQVFLDGKDEQGHTKYLNEDGTRHTHLGSSQQQSQSQGSTTIVTQQTKEDRVLNLLNDLSVKMNHVIKLLEGKDLSK